MISAQLRSNLYGMLSDFFLYPDHEGSLLFDRELLHDAAALMEIDGPPEVKVQEIQELQMAFTGLFVNRLGGVRAHPYGAVYLEAEPRLMGDSSQAVLAAYREAGLTPEDSSEPPDSLTMELAFMAHLTQTEALAIETGDNKAREDTRLKQIKFCRDFLHPWVFRFCRRLTGDETAHPLYGWGACLLEDFSLKEQQWMAETATN